MMKSRGAGRVPILILAVFFYIIMNQMNLSSASTELPFFFIETIACIGFPLLLLTAGAYLADPTPTISEKRYRSYGLRTLGVLAVFWIGILIWDCIDQTIVIKEVRDVWNVILYGVVEKSYWGIYVLTGVWIILPPLYRLLKEADKQKVSRWIGGLFVVTVLFELLHVAGMLPDRFLYLSRVLSYLMYLLIGWYLEQSQCTKKERYWWAGLAVIFLAFIWLGSWFWNQGREDDSRSMILMEPSAFWVIGWSVAFYRSVLVHYSSELAEKKDWNLSLIIQILAGMCLTVPVLRRILEIWVPLKEMNEIGLFFILLLLCLAGGALTAGSIWCYKKLLSFRQRKEKEPKVSWISLGWRIYPGGSLKKMWLPLLVLIGSWFLYLVNWKLIEESELVSTMMIWTVLAGITIMAFVRIRLNSVAEWILKGSCIILIPMLCFYLLELCAENSTIVKVPTMNWLAYLVIFVILFAISSRVTVASMLELILMTIVGLVEHFILSFRGTPVRPSDIFSLQTAASVADQYEVNLTASALFAILVILFALLLFSQLKREKWKWQRHVATIGAALIVVFSYVGFVRADGLVKNGFSRNLWEQKAEYQENGFLLSFINDLSHFSMSQPEEYDREKAAKSIEENKEDSKTPEVRPTIIAIMNESFTDMTKKAPKGSLVVNEDPLPFIHSWKKDVIKGDLVVSVFGGGTACTELEFLTGQSMEFYPSGSVPYQQFIHKPTNSMASLLKTYGYKTVALHPFNSEGWSRDKVYPLLGFDEFISIDEIEEGDKKWLRQYISDEGSYLNIIKQFEEKGDDPLFLFNVTMQNHGGFGESEGFEPNISAKGYDNVELDNYLSLTSYSDKALKDLISYFSKQEEPVIICFFGDHWPKIGGDMYEKMFQSNSDLEKMFNIYSTPFYIWSNYDMDPQGELEMEGKEAISSNYLGKHILQLAGIPLNDWFQEVDKIEKKLPVLSDVGWIDEKKKRYLMDEALINSDTYKEYQNAQYYYFYDKK